MFPSEEWSITTPLSRFPSSPKSFPTSRVSSSDLGGRRALPPHHPGSALVRACPGIDRSPGSRKRSPRGRRPSASARAGTTRSCSLRRSGASRRPCPAFRRRRRVSRRAACRLPISEDVERSRRITRVARWFALALGLTEALEVESDHRVVVGHQLQRERVPLGHVPFGGVEHHDALVPLSVVAEEFPDEPRVVC